MKTKTNIIHPAFALLAFACFAFSSGAQAVRPAPDGFYSGFNTAEWQNAFVLMSNTPATSAQNLTKAQKVQEHYGRLPLSFEPVEKSCSDFVARGAGYSLSIQPTRIDLSLNRAPKGNDPVRIAIEFQNARSTAKAESLDLLPGKINYLVGSDTSRWRQNVPTYGKVRYHSIYPGIDVVHYGNNRQLEFDTVVNAHADPRQIRLKFTGVERVKLGKEGEAILVTRQGKVKLNKPVAYQRVGSERKLVEAEYRILGSAHSRYPELGFKLAKYDRNEELIIDPVLVYSTMFGGEQVYASAVAADTAGNVYLAGSSEGTTFAGTSGSFQQSSSGGRDVFICKINPTGTQVLYSTYIGGSSTDTSTALGIDSAGNAIVTGSTYSHDFPLVNAAQSDFRVQGDSAFVTKLDPTGSSLVYSTFLSGTGDSSRGYGVAVDGTGSAYVTGRCTTDFPISSGAYNPGPPVNPNAFVTFLVKLSPAGAIMYSTRLGSNYAVATSVAVDASGEAFVGGWAAAGLPVSATAYMQTFTPGPSSTYYSSNNGGFVAKFSADASALVYCTYVGAVGEGQLQLAIDSQGNAYLTGATNDPNFPTKNAIQPLFGGGSTDAFIVKLNAEGSDAIYSTFLGGSGEEDFRGEWSLYSAGIAVDGDDYTYVTGFTTSPDFPTINAIQPNLAPDTSGVEGKVTSDAFLTKIDPQGANLVYSTYFGGPSAGDASEWGVGVGLDGHGNAYLAGTTRSYAFPTTPGVIQTTKPSDFPAAFVAKISGAAPVTNHPPTLTEPAAVSVVRNNPTGAIVALTTHVTDVDGDGLTVTWNVDGTDVQTDIVPPAPAGSSTSADVSFSYNYPEGAHTVAITVSDGVAQASTATTVTVTPPVSTANAQTTGGGSISTPEGKANFGFVGQVDRTGRIKGNMEYTLATGGRRIRSLTITAVEVAGTHARVFGTATVNSMGNYNFVLDVDDLTEPGTGHDRFQLQVADGYSVTGVLTGGNIQIH